MCHYFPGVLESGGLERLVILSFSTRMFVWARPIWSDALLKMFHRCCDRLRKVIIFTDWKHPLVAKYIDTAIGISGVPAVPSFAIMRNDCDFVWDAQAFFEK